MATKKKEEMIEEVIVAEEPKIDPVEEFIARKLKAVNEMEDRAKARKLAERILANRKGIR